MKPGRVFPIRLAETSGLAVSMDIKLHRPHGCCHHSRRAFVPGELLYSALARGPTGLERIDCAAECWSGPPEQTLAWWRSTFPAAQGGAPELAPVDVLLDVLELCERASRGTAGPADRERAGLLAAFAASL